MAKDVSNQSAKRPAAGAKGKKKKWSKGKTNDRLDNAVLFEKAAYDAAVKGIPALKLITTATVSDKFKITGSLARAIIKELAAKNLIKPIALHSHFIAYTKA